VLIPSITWSIFLFGASLCLPLREFIIEIIFPSISDMTSLIATRTPIIIPRQKISLAMLSLIGVFGFIAQTLMTMGYQIEAAGRASMGVYTQMIFGVILERLVFGTVPGPLSILGTCLILGSGLYVTMTKATEGNGASADGKIALPEGEDVENGSTLFVPYEDEDMDANE
jgi:drug/metabolite transporter (DMT)-like permease